ncbi:hypothetical protein KAR91_35620 [Candidatus Pacearchaeota archaeon]|nr:hypothetical protein [Candidatus Pacearchaeota archaeon]
MEDKVTPQTKPIKDYEKLWQDTVEILKGQKIVNENSEQELEETKQKLDEANKNFSGAKDSLNEANKNLSEAKKEVISFKRKLNTAQQTNEKTVKYQRELEQDKIELTNDVIDLQEKVLALKREHQNDLDDAVDAAAKKVEEEVERIEKVKQPKTFEEMMNIDVPKSGVVKMSEIGKKKPKEKSGSKLVAHKMAEDVHGEQPKKAAGVMMMGGRIIRN